MIYRPSNQLMSKTAPIIELAVPIVITVPTIRSRALVGRMP